MVTQRYRGSGGWGGRPPEKNMNCGAAYWSHASSGDKKSVTGGEHPDPHEGRHASRPIGPLRLARGEGGGEQGGLSKCGGLGLNMRAIQLGPTVI